MFSDSIARRCHAAAVAPRAGLGLWRGLRHWRRLGLGLVLVVFMAPTAHAQTDAATAQWLMRASGLWQQLEDIAPQVRAGFVQASAQAGAKPSEAEAKRLDAAIDSAYAPAALRAAAQSVLVRDFQPRHLAALQSWFNSRDGQTITQLEERASADPRPPAERAQQGVQVLGAAPAARREMLQRLVQVSRAAETAVEVTIQAALGVRAGVASATPDYKGPSEADVRAALEAQRGAMTQAYGPLMVALFAGTYAEIADSALSAYVALYEADAGQHFNNVLTEALTSALSAAATDLGRRIPSLRDGAST